MRRYFAFIALTLIVAGGPRIAQAADRPRIEGLSIEKLDRIRTLFEEAVTQKKIAGGVALVARKGKVVYSWGGIFYTYFWVDPKQELIGIMMTQIYPSNHLHLREDFQRLTYEALAE